MSLIGDPDFSSFCDSDINLAYGDADWNQNPDTRKSAAGWAVWLYGRYPSEHNVPLLQQHLVAVEATRSGIISSTKMKAH